MTYRYAFVDKETRVIAGFAEWTGESWVAADGFDLILVPTGDPIVGGAILPDGYYEPPVGVENNRRIYTGLRGAPGPVGPTGAQGVRGDRGIRGPVGRSGPVGQQGIRGGAGPVGDCGPSGSVGPRGPAGERGVPGPRGERGEKGERGSAGATGHVGPAGKQGPVGVAGATGAVGPAGADGVVVVVVGDAIHSGIGAPVDRVGETGQFYIDTESQTLYGPKKVSSWPRDGYSLRAGAR